ncbi:MAG: 5-methyltetrahydropteroyltriglutamate--homocysteine methyltransferase [Gammaproteobacteria bacterium]|nr:5-methyltetrahydropteroyltriglutamate--homocysteine methyltransferase [Gammaproteobacteria bacterium]
MTASKPSKPLLTTVVGSYPQPAWLVDQDILKAKLVPRIHAPEIWRVAPSLLQEAQDDATRLAIRDQERAGIDIITDGEIRRESYSNRFGTSLSGIDLSRPFIRKVESFEIPVPRVTGALTRPGPVEVADLLFLKANTNRGVKITLPGPFTLSKQAFNEFYPDEESLAMAYAEVVNQEARDLEAAGADVIQLDEPWLRSDADGANRYGIEAINRALEGIRSTTAVHLCFGYGFVMSAQKPKAYAFLSRLADCVVDQISIEAAQPHLDLGVLEDLANKTIILGVVDLSTNEVESVDTLAQRIRRALPHVSPDRLMPAPDCGLKYLTREAAFGKLQALSAAARQVREELGLGP